MAERRVLRFGELNEILHDVATLQLRGYDRVGRWNLGQNCAHIADWMSYPLDGYPKAPWFLAPMLWGMKVTIGKRQLHQILSSGVMKAGGPTMPVTVHTSEIAELEAVDRLINIVRRFEAHRGKVHPSPLFGQMDREQMLQLQLIHAAHHLSFLIPKPAK